MISFTVKGKNFPPGAAYWVPYYYHTAEDMEEANWRTQLTKRAPISQPVEFTNIEEIVGFVVFFGSATAPEHEADIWGPYAYAATSPQLLKDNGKYILDFHGEVGYATLLEEEAALPDFLKWLIPWSPLFGPPVPKLLPPWPWWFSRWQEGWEESPPW